MIGPDEHRLVKHKGATMASAALHKLGDERMHPELVSSYADGMINGTASFLVASFGSEAALDALALAIKRLLAPQAHEV